MFKCTQCNRTFTRKGSLLRHMKRLVHTNSNIREFPSNNNDGTTKNQFENTVDQWTHNDSNINSAENKISLAQHEPPESDYEDNDSKNDFSFERNSTEGEDISPMFQNKHDDDVDRSEESLNPFDKSMIAAVEAIKTKFNSLKNSHNILKSVNSRDIWSNANESKDLPTSNIYKETSFTPKIAGILQTALDLLMIKELQNACAEDEEAEQNEKNYINQRKRNLTSNLINRERNEDVEVKRLKNDNSVVTENANLLSDYSKYVEEEHWYDPNPAVDELRNLVINTQIGKEMFEIIHNLMERSSNIRTTSFADYFENEKQRNELMKNLHKLKETEIGGRIVSIIHELEKYEIIESGLSELLNNDEDSDVEESIVGRG